MLVFCCCSCFVVGDLCRSGCRQNFANFYLVLNVRRLYTVVDSLISAAKVCDCVISAWC